MDWTGLVLHKKMLLAFFAIIAFAGSETISEDRFLSEQHTRGRDLQYSYSIATFAYTAIGWNYTEIEYSILKENLDYVKTAPKPINASAIDSIEVLPEHAFVTTEVLNNRNLAVLLSQNVPEPDPLSIPCIINSNSPDDLVVTRMSCLARERYVVYVTGILEKAICEDGLDCREDGLKIFSTTVVFGKNGQIIAKYRKFNMVDEPALDAASEQDFVTFQTESNATIGLLTGHDLLFNEPAQTLFAKGVKYFVLNGAWKNKMPFTIATSTQLGWAQMNDVSLITSNYMRPELGYTGNGLYNYGYTVSSIGIQIGSGGYIHSVYSVTGVKSQSKNQNADDGKPLVRDIQMESQDLIGWASAPVPQSNNEPSTIQVCHGEEFCCILTYMTIRSAENAYYQLIAYDGNRTDSEGKVLYPEQTCGLVACSGADVKTCGANKNDVLYTNDVSFTVLKLSGLFSSTKVAPVTMVGNEYMFPLGGPAELSSSPQGDRYNVTYDYKGSGFLLVHSFALTSTDYSVTPAAGVEQIVAAPFIVLLAIACQKLFG